MKGKREGDSAYLAKWVFNQAMENLLRRGEITYNPKSRTYSPGPNLRGTEEEGTDPRERKT